jgi:membrane protein DedA with SNARE-associated domain
MEKLVEIFQHWMEPAVLTQYREYLIGVVLVYSFVEIVFPPLPGDALLILSGSIAGIAGFNPLLIIVSSALGSWLGSWLLYNLGNRMEHRMLASPKFSGFLDSAAFGRVEHWFRKFGYLTILFSRFIPVFRSGIILAAGMVGLDRRKSLIAVGISILIWNSTLVLGGRILGRHWEKIFAFWHARLRLLFISLIGLLLIYFIVAWIVGFVRKRFHSSRDGRRDE